MIKFPRVVVVEAENSDRSEFIRDAEAARRLGDPRATRLYLKMLCRRRAWLEISTLPRDLMHPADIADVHAAKCNELMSFCKAMGYDQTEATFTSVRTFLR